MLEIYYHSADSVILMYDVTNIDTFNNVINWLKEINEHVVNKDHVTVYIIGNKCDINPQILNKTKELLQNISYKHLLMTNTNSSNVNKIFSNILKNMIINKEKQKEIENQIYNNMSYVDIINKGTETINKQSKEITELVRVANELYFALKIALAIIAIILYYRSMN